MIGGKKNWPPIVPLSVQYLYLWTIGGTIGGIQYLWKLNEIHVMKSKTLIVKHFHFISITFLLHFYFIPNKEHHKINALLIQVLCAANHAAIRPDSRNYGRLAARSAALFFLVPCRGSCRWSSNIFTYGRSAAWSAARNQKKKCRRLCRFSSKFLIFWSTSGTISGTKSAAQNRRQNNFAADRPDLSRLDDLRQVPI